MAVTLKQLWAGGTENTSTTIKARVDLGGTETLESNYRVYAMHYSREDEFVKIYCNNVLIQTVTGATGSMPWFENVLIGGDEDNFVGYMPEVYIIKIDDAASFAESNIINYSKYLGDKWLPTGTDMNGYTVQASAGTAPSFGAGYVTDWLHFDETTIVNDGLGFASNWNDKAGYGAAGNKTGVYQNVPTSNKLPIGTVKGKNAIHFTGDNYFKASVQNAGSNQAGDPNSMVVFVVAKFDDYDTTGGTGQLLLGNRTNEGAWSPAIRLKKYPSESFLNLRFYTGSSFNYLEVPRDKVLDITSNSGAESASLRLLYSKDETFTTGVTYSPVITITDTNKGAVLYPVDGLDTASTYYIKAEIDSVIQTHTAKFKTLPSQVPTGFSFIFGSCNQTNSNHIIWDAMRDKNPDMFIHMGDLHYNDISTPDTDLYRDAFNSTVEQDRQKLFWSNQSNYYMWDDHDYGANNSDKDSPSRANALEFYLSNVPVRNIVADPETNGISQYWIVGRCLFILTDCRSNRDDWMIDTEDPDKKLLGDYTKQWFKDLLLFYKGNTDLDICFWMNPVGWTGEIDNPYSWTYGVTTEVWSAYLAERRELANFMYYNNIPNVIICNGDTHQVAIDDGRNNFYATDATGNQLDAKNVAKTLQHMVIEGSPFDRDPDRQGGPFQIDDSDDSGGVYPAGSNNFTLVTVNDLGGSWIEVIVQQYGYFSFYEGGNELYSVREYKKQYSTKKSLISIPAPAPYKSPYKVDEGTFTVPEGVHGSFSGKTNITYPPTPFNNMWRANISGYYTGTLGINLQARLIRRSDTDTFITLSGINSTTGYFNLVPPSPNSGTIVIQIWDTEFDLLLDEWVNDFNDSNKLENLTIQRFVVTDIPYFSGQSINAPANFEWKMGYRQTEGTVNFKLYKPDTDEFVATSPVRTDLPRSFIVDDNDEEVESSPFPSRAYLYDMALTLISAVGMKDYKFADRVLQGIMNSQYPNGAFPFSVNHLNPDPTLQDPYFRTGAIAWVAYSLGYYLQYRLNSPLKSACQASLVQVLNYIESLMDNPIGLPTGGKGRYEVSGGLEVFNPDYVLPWISTEHNIDSYFAFKQAGKVLGSQYYRDKSIQIKDIMLVQLWDSTNNRFYQGINNAATNDKDTADALDCNSWGAIMLFAAGETVKAKQLLTRLDSYYKVTDEVLGITGYKPYSPSWGYPGAVDTIWIEGTLGAALAFWRAKDYEKYSEVMANVDLTENEDGSYRYAALRDEVYQISNYPSTCSTSWRILSGRLKSTVWT
jgi:hypothetical protein